MLVALYGVDARVTDLKFTPTQWLYLPIVYLIQALILGLLEESLFRGILHHRLRVDAPRLRGWALGLLSAFIFAAAHFLRPVHSRAPAPWWETSLNCVGGLGRIITEWPDAVGLLLVGLVLVVLRKRFGSIWLPLGVHAGWVWITKLSRKTLDDVKSVTESNPIFWGSEQVYDGVVGWTALVATLLICLWFRLPKPEERTPPVSDETP
jgi:membrane protease YdiL (CAAX protease family)